MNTSCHIGNRIYFWAGTRKTSYEIWKEKKPKVKYFRAFGSKCYILNPRKFVAKSDEGIFLGHSTNSRAYRVYNKHTKMMMESINVVIDDTISEKDIDDDGCKVECYQPSCWLYSVPNLLVFLQLVTLYLSGILVSVMSEIV